MPKIVSYTPPWLSRPSSGSKIFTDASLEASPDLSKSSALPRLSEPSDSHLHHRPRRLIAKRGHEIFVVVGNQLRWSDLLLQQSKWESRKWKTRETLESSSVESSYRKLSLPIYHQIQQLVISPSGFFLAILTQHTVYIACLPHSSHLQSEDRTPLKLKTYQLGPTTHVIPKSPVVAALWHPLAVSTSTEDCFITVTANAAVRVWELDRNVRWTFDEPALAVDLRKLINGTSCNQDFRPPGFNIRTGFSADFVDMEVSSACFGGQGDEEEDGWAAMTLWFVMRTGDVYALCPILPSRWAPSPTTIPSLSISVVSQMADMQAAPSDSDDQDSFRQQYQWVQELDAAEPIIRSTTSGNGDPGPLEIRSRPTKPSAIPRLQGPFQFDAEDADFGMRDFEASDIYVMAPKTSREDFDLDENGQSAGVEGLPVTVVCIVTSDRQLLVCLSLDGVQGQWLHITDKVSFMIPPSTPKDLILIESHCLTASNSGVKEGQPTDWPLVTPEYFSPHNFYVTCWDSVYHVSLQPWISRLDRELNLNPSDEGLELRLEVTCEDNVALTEALLIAEADSPSLSACESFFHDDFGYLLLTFTSHRPHALILDLPHTHPESCTHSPTLRAVSAELTIPETPVSLDLAHTRPAYQPPQSFYASPTASLTQLRSRMPARHRHTLSSEIRLSPHTLETFALVHRILSKETHALELSAAQLFRRVDRLRNEVKEQIMQMVNVGEKLQGILRDGEELRLEKGGRDKRMEEAEARQLALTRRWDELRRKLAKAELLERQGRELSLKEKGWIHEVETVATNFGVVGDDGRPEAGEPEDNSSQDKLSVPQTNTLGDRYDTIAQLSSLLLPEAQRIVSQRLSTAKDADPTVTKSTSPGKTTATPPSLSRSSSAAARLPPKLHQANVADVMSMVERESAVIEAAMKRLERLTLEAS